MRLDRRVDTRHIRQISQKIGKLWSPDPPKYKLEITCKMILLKTIIN